MSKHHPLIIVALAVLLAIVGGMVRELFIPALQYVPPPKPTMPAHGSAPPLPAPIEGWS